MSQFVALIAFPGCRPVHDGAAAAASNSCSRRLTLLLLPGLPECLLLQVQGRHDGHDQIVRPPRGHRRENGSRAAPLLPPSPPLHAQGNAPCQ